MTRSGFEYYLGTPEIVVPDNPRTGVDRAASEHELNRTYMKWLCITESPVCQPPEKTGTGQVENAVSSER